MPSLKPCMTARRCAAARSMRACHCAVSRLSAAFASVETSCITATPLGLDNQADLGSHCTCEIASAGLAWLGAGSAVLVQVWGLLVPCPVLRAKACTQCQ